jgi:hypothetical protein
MRVDPPVKFQARRSKVIPPERPSICIHGGSGANKSEGPVAEAGIIGNQFPVEDENGARRRCIQANGTNSIIDLSAQGRHPANPSTFGLECPHRQRAGGMTRHGLKVYQHLINTSSAHHLYAVGRLAATDLSGAGAILQAAPPAPSGVGGA